MVVLALVFAMGALGIFEVPTWQRLLFGLGTVGATVGIVIVTATPRFLPGRLSVGAGPLRRTFHAQRYAKVATRGPSIVLVRANGSIQPVLTPSRFVDPERLRFEVAAWGREQGLEVVD